MIKLHSLINPWDLNISNLFCFGHATVAIDVSLLSIITAATNRALLLYTQGIHNLSLQAFKGLSNFLNDKLSSLAAFRSAELAWSVQLEALYQTPAVSKDCREQLQQLEHYGQQLLQHVQHIEVSKRSIPLGRARIALKFQITPWRSKITARQLILC